MRKFQKLLLALALLGAFASPAFSQTGLTGNESWNTTGGVVNSNQVRAGTANVVLSAVTAAFTVGLSSANVTVTGTPGLPAVALGGNVLITAQPSAAVITMPPSPIPDGAIVGVCNASGAAWVTNAVTLAANSAQTLAQAATLTTLAAGTCAREQWNQSQATWYRVQ